jgi:hypothetical protein
MNVGGMFKHASVTISYISSGRKATCKDLCVRGQKQLELTIDTPYAKEKNEEYDQGWAFF